MPQIAILGGGLTGLSTAYHLRGKDWALYERADTVGGLCRTVRQDGFLFDYTGHWLHLSRERTRRLVRRLLPGGVERHRRDAWIFSQGRYTRYPFQANTYGLPPETVKACLLGFIEACHGKKRRRPAHFEEWILQYFGKGIARHFMIPYNRKLWTVPPRQLTCDWLGPYVPTPDLDAVITGAITDTASSVGYNASFVYPREGGIQSLVEAFRSRLPERRVHTGREVTAVDLSRRRLRTRDGGQHPFEKLVVTMPLHRFLERLDPLPETLAASRKRLRHNSVWNLNLGLSHPVGEGRHWIYFPERDYAFYRVGFPANVTASAAPAGCGSVYTEVAYRGRPPDPKALRDRLLRDLRRAGILRDRRNIVAEIALHIPCAYVIFDGEHRKAVRKARRTLERKNVFLAGRYGAWEYSAMEDAILWGARASAWAKEGG